MATMTQQVFTCIDGHTCGNPVRLVTAGAPRLDGKTMLERRAQFVEDFDWIRTGLMFEPRGHDQMSGAILYPPTRADCDVAVLFIETTGCLPMCGHGTIGVVTMALEHGLVTPREPGLLRLDTPAGLVIAHYVEADGRIEEVRLTNVPSFLVDTECRVIVEGLGEVVFDIAYGGNFYAIIESQPNFRDIADHSALDLVMWSRAMRAALDASHRPVHPTESDIAGIRHILWTGVPTKEGATARNAVFYGEKAIDRSPCGTGTSARMAQWAKRGDLAVGDVFVHESIIGSLFTCRVEAETTVEGLPAILPSIGGWARTTGFNEIIIDDRDPYATGFSVT